jgi:hypothetical protein
VIDAFEALFFSCRDRLEARDWIVTRAIGLPSVPDPNTLIKLFAFFGGVLVLEAILDHLQRDEQDALRGEIDPVRSLLDLMMLPLDEKASRLLDRIRLELMRSQRDRRDHEVAEVRELRRAGGSILDLALQLCAHDTSRARESIPTEVAPPREPSLRKSTLAG